MTAANRWTTYLALPFAAFFEAAGYYAMRSVLMMHLMDSGAGSYEDMRSRLLVWIALIPSMRSWETPTQSICSLVPRWSLSCRQVIS